MSTNQPDHPSPDAAAPSLAPPLPAPAPARRAGSGLTWLALLLAALSLVLAGLLWQKLSFTQQELARRAQDSGAQAVEARTMAAQAIPSYAPKQAMAHFNKLECFCFTQYTLQAGEKKEWPVAFVIDPRLPKDVTTITLSYTFFEVGGKVPAAPADVAFEPAIVVKPAGAV